MDLKEYMKKYGVPKTFLAKKAGICYITLIRIEKGENVTLSNILAIERATEGKVTAQDMINKYAMSVEVSRNKKDDAAKCNE